MKEFKFWTLIVVFMLVLLSMGCTSKDDEPSLDDDDNTINGNDHSDLNLDEVTYIIKPSYKKVESRYDISKEDVVVWNTSFDAGIHSAPLIYNGNVYICTGKGNLFSLNKDSGKRNWYCQTNFEIDEELHITYPSEKLITYSRSYDYDSNRYICNVICININDGVLEWEQEHSATIIDLQVLGEKIMILSEDKVLTAVEPDDGTQCWNFSFEEDYRFSIDDATESVICITAKGALFEIAIDNGTILSITDLKIDPVEFWVEGYVSVLAGNIYYSTPDSIFRISRSDNKILWNYSNIGIPNRVQLLENNLFCSISNLKRGFDSAIMEIDKDTGQLKQYYSFNYYITDFISSHSPPITLSGNHIYLNNGRKLFALDLNNGLHLDWYFAFNQTTLDAIQSFHPLFAITEKTSTPVIDSGILYTGSQDGNLYAIDLNKSMTVAGVNKNQKPELGLSNPNADDWSTIRHDTCNSGYIDVDLKADINLKWRFEIDKGDEIVTTPVAIDDHLYFRTEWGYIYDLNITTQEVNWRLEIGEDVFLSSITIVGHYAVFISDGLWVIDLMKRETLWYKYGILSTSSPMITNDVIYIHSYAILAFDLFSGDLLWSHNFMDFGFSTPAYSNDMVIVYSADGYIYALDASTGRLHWKFNTGSGGTWYGQLCSPVISNGRIIIGSYSGTVFSINVETGQEIWNYSTLFHIVASLAMDSTNIYVSSMDGYFYSLSKNDGSLIWSKKLSDSDIVSSPVVTKSHIIIAYDYWLDERPKKGYGIHIIDKQNIDSSDSVGISGYDTQQELMPIIADGKIILCSKGGYLFIIE